MFKNYFKIAFRSIKKNKTYSFINVFGLGLGLATAFILLLWVNNEYSMNKYHTHSNRIYQLNAKIKSGTDPVIWENTPAPLVGVAKESISSIEKIARLQSNYGFKQAVKYNGNVFIEDKIGYTENELFDIFDFSVKLGDPREPFSKGLSVIITESTAKKYFGDENPIGKIISFRDTTIQVSAVLKDFPANSSIQFNMLFSLDIVRAKFRGRGQWKTMDQDWNNSNYSTFCLMKKDANLEEAATVFQGALKKVYPEDAGTQYLFRPLKNMYLYKTDGSKGRIILVEIFFMIAIFVLLIACINYINLVTARATQRVKEISIRKIVGAGKLQLFWQFFIETGVLLCFAVFAALLLADLMLPLYRQVSGNSVTYDLSSWRILKVLLEIVACVWLLTGLYPALLLSSFKPLQSLKGIGFLSNVGFVRKSLVVLQFVVSITLLLTTVVIHRQMDYVQNKDLHINIDNTLVLPVWKLKGQDAVAFREELNQLSYVKETTVSSASLFEGANSSTDIEWPGKQKDDKLVITQFDVDKNFMQFFHAKMKEGTDFEKVSPGSKNFILNETAVKKMGLQDPVGQTIKFHSEAGVVIGVIEDFYFEGYQRELAPAILEYNPDETSVVYARIQQKDAQKAIASAQSIWKKYESTLPLEYAFLDANFAKQYDKETRASKLFDAFALITLLISCLGLFGLATHSAERRVKEIGIRKVLGADIRHITLLLTKEFVVLVLLAIIVAVPVVWVGMDKLLDYFIYRISLQWWVFLVACAGAVFIALLTVGVQAVKAGVANPVKSLRTE